MRPGPAVPADLDEVRNDALRSSVRDQIHCESLADGAQVQLEPARLMGKLSRVRKGQTPPATATPERIDLRIIRDAEICLESRPIGA